MAADPAEEFMLAAWECGLLSDEKERAIRAACVLELALAGKVIAAKTGWFGGCRLIKSNTALEVSDPKPTGDPLLDGGLRALADNSGVPRRWLFESYHLRLIQRSLLSHTRRSRMLRRDLYAPHAESVARVHTRLRAAVEGREPLDGRTGALSVVLGYPKFRGPLTRQRRGP